MLEKIRKYRWEIFYALLFVGLLGLAFAPAPEWEIPNVFESPRDYSDWCLESFRPEDSVAVVLWVSEDTQYEFHNTIVGRPNVPNLPEGAWEKRGGVKDYMGNSYTMWWPKPTLLSCLDFYGVR